MLFVLLILVLLVFNLFVFAEEGDTGGTPEEPPADDTPPTDDDTPPTDDDTPPTDDDTPPTDDDTPPTDDDTPPTDDDTPPTDDPFDEDSADSEDGDTWESGPSESEEDLKIYGCWNSQPIASDETIMNIQFDVEYQEKNSEVSYNDIFVNVEYEIKTINLELLKQFRRDSDFELDIAEHEGTPNWYNEIEDIDWKKLPNNAIFYLNETLGKYQFKTVTVSNEDPITGTLNSANSPLLLGKIPAVRSSVLNPLLGEDEGCEKER